LQIIHLQAIRIRYHNLNQQNLLHFHLDC
jgi:hypothetical protein